MQKCLKIGYIVFFISILALPFVLAHREENRISEYENRYYANFPRFYNDEGSINIDYIQDFEDWINDNARFRTIFRELKVSLLYYLFGYIEMENVGVGTNGELYRVDKEAIETYQGRNLFGEKELENIEALIFNLQQELEKQNVGFYFMICHDKMSIYPQNYPKGVVRYEVLQRGQQVENYIEEKNRINNILLYDVLMKETDNNIYYQYLDSCHWNHAGTFIGYQKLMKEINEKYPDVKGLKKSDFNIEEFCDEISIYGFDYPVKGIWENYGVKQKNAVEVKSEFYEEFAYKEHTHYYQNSGGNYRILLVNDSFIRITMKEWVAESFEETLTVDLSNLVRIREIVEKYQPDIVVLECLENNIPRVYTMLSDK